MTKLHSFVVLYLTAVCINSFIEVSSSSVIIPERESIAIRKSTKQKCPSGQVYVNHPNANKCLEKVSLNGVCNYDAQCNSVVAYSFCGWSVANYDNTTCRCMSGYTMTTDGKDCIPVQECSIETFNSAMLQANCGLNQFCRNGICMCRPNYRLDRDNNCVPLLADEVEVTSTKLDKVKSTDIEVASLQDNEHYELKKAILETNIRIDMLTDKLNSLYCFAIGLLLVLVFTVALVALRRIILHINRRDDIAAANEQNVELNLLNNGENK